MNGVGDEERRNRRENYISAEQGCKIRRQRCIKDVLKGLPCRGRRILAVCAALQSACQEHAIMVEQQGGHGVLSPDF